MVITNLIMYNMSSGRLSRTLDAHGKLENANVFINVILPLYTITRDIVSLPAPYDQTFSAFFGP